MKFISGLSKFTGGWRVKLNREIIVAVIFLIGTTVYLSQALKLPFPFKVGEPGPALFPLILIAIMYVTSLRILFHGLFHGLRKEEKFTAIGKNIKKPIVAIGLTALYIGMFSVVGYWASTIFYSFCLALFFEYGRKSKKMALILSAIIGTAVAVGGYVFFEVFFNIRLPKGGW